MGNRRVGGLVLVASLVAGVLGAVTAWAGSAPAGTVDLAFGSCGLSSVLPPDPALVLPGPLAADVVAVQPRPGFR
jgi:hypothetical protein